MWAHVRAFYGGSDVALGHAYSHITAVIAAAQIVGGPLAALLLRLDGFWGLAGWQFLFLVRFNFIFFCFLYFFIFLSLLSLLRALVFGAFFPLLAHAPSSNARAKPMKKLTP